MTDEPIDPDAAARASLVPGLVARVRLPEPPASLRHALDELFETWARQRVGPGLKQRLVAALVGDAGAGALAPGWRGAAPGAARQLLFRIEGTEVALDLRPGPDGTTIDGQVFAADGEPAPGTVVELRGPAGAVDECALDPSGSFVFTEVGPGTHELVVVAPGVELVLAPVEVDPRP